MHLSDLFFGKIVVFVRRLAAHDPTLVTGLSDLSVGSNWELVEAEVCNSAA